MYASRKTTSGIHTQNGVTELPETQMVFTEQNDHSCLVTFVGILIALAVVAIVLFLL